MSTTSDSQSPAPGKGASAAEIEADIERTREQLGETVEALTERLDVKTQAKHKAREVRLRLKDAVTDDGGRLKPVIPAGVVGAVAVVVAVALWRRSR